MSNLNRRECLKRIGAVSTAPLLSNTVQGQNELSEVDAPLRKLTGREANKVISESLKDEKYHDVKRALIQDGYTPNPKQRNAYEITPDGRQSGEAIKVAVFEHSHRKNDQLIAEVGVSTGKNDLMKTRATITKTGKSGFPTQIIYYTPDSAEFQVDDLINQSTNIASDLERIDLGAKSVNKHIHDLSDLQPTSNISESQPIGNVGGGFSIAQIHPDCLDQYEGSAVGGIPCWGCKDIVSVVNVVGCGAATWLICGAIGVGSGGMGGLACGTVVGVVCWVINHFGTNNPTDVCKMMCSC